jgi:hypothetical protein
MVYQELELMQLGFNSGKIIPQRYFSNPWYNLVEAIKWMVIKMIFF